MFSNQIRSIKYLLVFLAIAIAIGSLVTSNYLIKDLQLEEKYRMEVWAEAMRSLNTADENTDLNLVLRVINGNNTIPVIVVNDEFELISFRNIENYNNSNMDSTQILKSMASDLIFKGNYIKIDMPDDFGIGDNWTVCYDDSKILKRLNVYPYIQLGVVVIFVLVTIFALFATLRAEQNKVWVGLSKETAHQLGTPISSLMAWCAVLRDTYPDDVLIPEMENDVQRLERIAERFSKIGSIPDPKPEDITEVLRHVISYMRHRTSNKIIIICDLPEEPIIVNIIPSLFEWVAENLCKNAVDAMDGTGTLKISFIEEGNNVYIDFIDTGKGISKKDFNSIFQPGFTTKARGWGLGLSLAKRIIDDYHKGHIFVKESALGVGTTIRIELKKIIDYS